MSETNLLSLGTVVKLKESEALYFMVIGYYPVEQETEQLFEYSGLLYPQGFLNQGHIYMFNSQDIDSVVFQGYSDDESKEFREGIEGMVYLLGEALVEENVEKYINGLFFREMLD